jgi:hypothetical protein
MPCFRLEGKAPVERERLMMSVIGITRTTKHYLSSCVGSGSKEHDIVGDDSISLVTSAVDTDRNFSRSFYSCS